jgi:hypothetical protein
VQKIFAKRKEVTEEESTRSPGMDIRISVITQPFNPWVYAALLARTPTGERVPMWERALPLP